jgi:hypothetical protein
MPPLQRRLIALSALWGGLWVTLLVLLVGVDRLWAEGALPAEIMPVVNWLSFSGVVALVGVAVQWGATRERLKDITSLEDRIDGRFNRMERQIDALFRTLQAERRGQDRHGFGLRAPPETEDDGA